MSKENKKSKAPSKKNSRDVSKPKYKRPKKN